MSQDPEAGSRDEQSKVHGNGKKSADKEQPTRLCSVKSLLSVILLFVVLLCLPTFGGIVLVLYVVVIIIMLYHRVIASAIENKKYLLVNVIAMILDPLFFYILVLNDEKKCIDWDQTLGITATVIRSVLDFLKLVSIIFELHKANQNENQRGKLKYWWQQLKDFKGEELLEDPSVRMWMLFLIDCLAILPIPQVLVISGGRGTAFSTAMAFFISQYLLRVIRTFFLFTDAVEGSGVIADATWAIFAFYVLLYLQSGHMFGALWYYNAIEKATECWREACKNHTECGHSSFSCDGDYIFLNDFCGVSRGSTTTYSFGIYNDALQSGIVAETDFPKKLLRCLRWGLQNLSAFGQNLQATNDVGESIFSICMTIYGVVLFVFLIGRMQADTTRAHEINQTLRQIKQWKWLKDISISVLAKIRQAKREKLLLKHDIRIDSLVSDLPDDTAKQVKLHLGRSLLSKVQELKAMEAMLDSLCECLKAAYYNERSYIVREGNPVDEMLFVVRGKLRIYTSGSTVRTGSQRSGNRNHKNHHLKDRDFCGEELVAWFQADPYSSNFPVSTRTIQAITDVEAFVLMADDLQNLFIKLHSVHFLQLRWRFRRIRHAQK